MTEAEFQQAQDSGQVNIVSPPTPAPETDTTDSTIKGYEGLLDSIRRPRQFLSAIPTFTPQSFTDSIQFVDDGLSQYPVFYINGAWIRATNPPTFFDSFLDLINWSSLDGFTTTTIGSAGSTAIQSASVQLATVSGAVAGGGTFITQNRWYNIIEIGKPITVEWIIWSTDHSTAGGQFDGYLQMVEDPGSYPVTTGKHFGFWIDETNIKASCADGTTQSTTDTGEVITVAQGEQLRRLKAVYTPGTDIKFYINDVLKATHTTHLPDDAAHFRLALGVSTGNTASKIFNFGRVLIQKQY